MQTNEALVIQYQPFVRRLARYVKRGLPDNVSVEDLEQAGMMGLIESAPRFCASNGATFKTFAGHRIRGAMMDSVREGDWAPRSVPRGTRSIAKAIRDIEVVEQRPAREVEIAERLGLTLGDYRGALMDAERHHILSIDESPNAMDAESLSPRPEHEVERERFDLALRAAIAALPERERIIIEANLNAMTLREAGSVLGISEGRACQLRTQAMIRLRATLGDWK